MNALVAACEQDENAEGRLKEKTVWTPAGRERHARTAKALCAGQQVSAQELLTYFEAAQNFAAESK